MSKKTMRSRFKEIADALYGEGVYCPVVSTNSDGIATQVSSCALVRYPREGVEKYARRAQIAWYENHMSSACDRFVGYIAKKSASRSSDNELFKIILNDANWRGDSMEVFLNSFMFNAKARGSGLVLVDSPDTDVETVQDQIEARAVPYLVPIYPEDVYDYELDITGRFDWIKINVIYNDQPAVKYFDKMNWSISVGENEIKSGEHNLGECPVLSFTEFGDYPCIGNYAQIADISRRLYNAQSELDEILRAQTFSLLTYQIDKDETFNVSEVAKAVGTHNMLTYRGTNKPDFSAPPDGPAEIYLKVIDKLESSIKRIAMIVEAPDKAESGIALTIRFQALNSALTAFAKRMEDFERRIWRLVAAWMNIDEPPVELVWAKDYALSDLAKEIETLAAMKLEGFPKSAIIAQMRIVANLAFSGSDQDAKDKIDEDLQNELSDL